MDHPMKSGTDVRSQCFAECSLQVLKGESSLNTENKGECRLEVVVDNPNSTCTVHIQTGVEFSVSLNVSIDTSHSQVGRLRYLLDVPEHCFSLLLTFPRQEEMLEFKKLLQNASGESKSVSQFNERTEEASAAQYFQFYGYLSQQQNMMQDSIRTSTYQRAMLQNVADFQDKVVIDVGAGSGILSFFAIQAGARKVYAIEASSMAAHAEMLVKKNNLQDQIIVIPGKVEEVNVPEQVDMIISEPMGYMLYNERMLESYVHAKKWLKPGGKMFPTQGDLHIAPFFDDALYLEHFSKANFWYQNSFYGVDLSTLRQAALKEYFKQPVVDTFDVRILMAKPVTHSVDFLEIEEQDLHRMEIPLQFTILTSGSLHGLAFWFDVCFRGSQAPVWLSTAPHEPLTHWYQVRCLFQTPIFVKAGQSVSGRCVLNSNARQSYDVEFELGIDGTTVRSRNTVDLKNPYFRYTGGVPSVPAGCNNSSPTELYWSMTNGESMGGGEALMSTGGQGPIVNAGGIPAASVYNNSYGGGLWTAGGYTQPNPTAQNNTFSAAAGYVNSSYIASSQPALTFGHTTLRNSTQYSQVYSR
ncbi:histone-arginine methyltransferase CARMER [Nematostella vectensis]|uniref:histone-arginine methyltransferase CARMER n=1 Tax=Nematostella vectensis TaxID=45351 RepID=UPI0020778DCA|nr:histone-arginine methyltransferase CARMER [Nematostella vectensis]